MARIYLDIETYRKDKPFDEKVVAIGVIEDFASHNAKPLKEEARFRIFSEWSLGTEKAVIREFYGYLRQLIKNSRFLEVVGFGILRLDIPLLIQKGVEYGVGTISELNRLWFKAYTIDLFQCSLIANNMKFAGNSLENLAERIRKLGLQISHPYGKGREVREWYENREYAKIEEHLKSDLKIIREIYLTQSIAKVVKSSS